MTVGVGALGGAWVELGISGVTPSASFSMLCDAVGDAVASACARSIPERFPNMSPEAIMAAREAIQHARLLDDDCIRSPLKATAHATWHLHSQLNPHDRRA